MTAVVVLAIAWALIGVIVGWEIGRAIRLREERKW